MTFPRPARLIRLFAAATLLTGALSAQDASGRLSARDAGKLYDQIAEWMESTAVVVPELARAGAPLAENVRQSAQLLKSGPTRENSALLYKLITNARFAENKAIYDSSVKEMIQLAYEEVPRVSILQPSMDVAMQKDVMGYMYWFHLQPDYRQLYKS